jgi:low affinity Fe/Cu permease
VTAATEHQPSRGGEPQGSQLANVVAPARALRNPAEMASQVSNDVGFFDRFAGRAAGLASRAPFFAFCLLLVLIWLIQGAVTLAATGSFNSFLDATYQLKINTTTTIITFLMVALLQNSQTRENQATQHKLNAIADGVADLMEHVSEHNDDSGLKLDVAELRCAVGLESRESTTRNTRPQSHQG